MVFTAVVQDLTPSRCGTVLSCYFHPSTQSGFPKPSHLEYSSKDVGTVKNKNKKWNKRLIMNPGRHGCQPTHWKASIASPNTTAPFSLLPYPGYWSLSQSIPQSPFSPLLTSCLVGGNPGQCVCLRWLMKTHTVNDKQMRPNQEPKRKMLSSSSYTENSTKCSKGVKREPLIHSLSRTNKTEATDFRITTCHLPGCMTFPRI